MLVIARYNENIEWADNDFVVVQKDRDLPNIGREASSYLWFIIHNYENLKGVYQFRQGNASQHKVGVFDYKCTQDGLPHHGNLKIKDLADKLTLDIPIELEFTAGAQFDVTVEQIKQRSLEWYKHAYEVSMSDFPECAWCFERLWKYIFNF